MVKDNKLDKAAILTAFGCAVVTFVCGFVFCLSLLSSVGSCYLLVKDFMYSTRGYVFLTKLQGYLGEDFMETAKILMLSLLAFLALAVLAKAVFAKRQPEVKYVFPKEERKVSPVLPSSNIASRFVDETEVASVLRYCRNNPEASSWKKLNSVDAVVLARYLKNECPQVVAVVLSKLEAKQCAAVLSMFNASFASDVIVKMMDSHSADADLAGVIGKTIADNIAEEKDILPHLANVFEYIDEPTEKRIFAALEENNENVAECIRDRILKFEDLSMLSRQNIEELLTNISEPHLVIALRGASDQIRKHFYSAMSLQQARIIQETLLRLGPIKLKDIEKAQQDIVRISRNLFADILRGK